MRRIARPVARGTVVLYPREGRRGEDLPPMDVEPPTDGWTLPAAVSASWAYASRHGLGRSAAVRGFHALADHFDPTLRRAEIRARLGDVDPFTTT